MVDILQKTQNIHFALLVPNLRGLRRFWRAFGLLGLASLLLLGTAAILAAIGFLAFLGSTSHDANLSASAWFPDYPRQNMTRLADWKESKTGWLSTSAALSITMCFIASASDDYLISATADANAVEPVLTSDNSSKELVTGDILRLYGAVPGPPFCTRCSCRWRTTTFCRSLTSLCRPRSRS